MAKVRVFRFKYYNINTGFDGPRKHMATLEHIEQVGGSPVLATAKEVDASELDGEGRYKEGEEEDEGPG